MGVMRASSASSGSRGRPASSPSPPARACRRSGAARSTCRSSAASCSASACCCSTSRRRSRSTQFLDGPRTVRDAVAVESGAFAFAKLLGFLGALVLAVGLVLVSHERDARRPAHEALRLHRDRRGRDAGDLPAPGRAHVLARGLGMLFLGRWPGGDLPAWKTGNAEPWPAPERPQRGRGRVATEPSSAPSTTPRAQAKEASLTREERSHGDRGSDARAATRGAAGPGEVLAARRLQGAGGRLGRCDLRAGRGLRGASGPSAPRRCTGTPSGTRCSTGRTRRSPSGSSAASSTSPTTASTATSRPATATASPTTGAVRRARSSTSPTPTCTATSRSSPTR